MESGRKDALAISARAIACLRSDYRLELCSEIVPRLSESLSIESMRADLSRVSSQYFFKKCPKDFALRNTASHSVSHFYLCCRSHRRLKVESNQRSESLLTSASVRMTMSRTSGESAGRDATQRCFCASATLRFQCAPGTECAHQTGSDLRVL